MKKLLKLSHEVLYNTLKLETIRTNVVIRTIVRVYSNDLKTFEKRINL